VERDKALEMAMGQIEKQFGRARSWRMGPEHPTCRSSQSRQGLFRSTIALGIGGLPRGRHPRAVRAGVVR